MNRTFSFVIAVALALCIGLIPNCSNAVMWASDWGGNLYTVNTSDAALTLVGNTGITNLGSLEFDRDGRLWGIQADQSDGNLWSINPFTASSAKIGGHGHNAYEGGLAFAPDGTAYATSHFDNGSYLYTIDMSTGDGTPGPALCCPTFSDVNGLAWRSDGMLIGLESQTDWALRTINPLNGEMITLASLPFAPGSKGGMSTDPSSGVSYFATGDEQYGSNSLYSFDLFTGSYSAIGSFSHSSLNYSGISGLAAFEDPSRVGPGAAPVPEPGTMVLFGFGAVSGAIGLRKQYAKRI